MRAPRQNGFTLIELMVVFALIGILTALILPEMKSTYEDALLRSTSRTLVDLCYFAHSRAITLNQPHRVRLDLPHGRAVVEAPAPDGAPGFVPVQDIPGGDGAMDRRISVALRKAAATPDNADAPAEEAPFSSGEPGLNPDDPDALVFYPDGTAEAAELLLRDREGFRRILRIHPVTARVQIIELGRE